MKIPANLSILGTIRVAPTRFIGILYSVANGVTIRRIQPMRSRLLLGAAALALFVGAGFADSALKSGPQVGKSPGAFNPLHATGPDEGQKRCLV